MASEASGPLAEMTATVGAEAASQVDAAAALASAASVHSNPPWGDLWQPQANPAAVDAEEVHA